MISNFEDLNKLFEEINSSLSEQIHLYVIGGAMLLYHGLKESTKDIDVIVSTDKEFFLLQRALASLNFIPRMPNLEYKRVDLSQIFVRDDFRIDLFRKTVCRGFHLSESMKSRALKIKTLHNLTVSLCSNEDVFLFKTFTERDGDIKDGLSLAQKPRGLDWDSILEELQHQINVSGNKVWMTWVGERLDILRDNGLEIPIMKEVDRLREEYFDGYNKNIHPNDSGRDLTD